MPHIYTYSYTTDHNDIIICTIKEHYMQYNNAYALFKCIILVQIIKQNVYVILEYTSIIPIFTRR